MNETKKIKQKIKQKKMQNQAKPYALCAIKNAMERHQGLVEGRIIPIYINYKVTYNNKWHYFKANKDGFFSRWKKRLTSVNLNDQIQIINIQPNMFIWFTDEQMEEIFQ